MSESSLDDSILIERAQRGDRHALDALISKHSAKAYQYALRLTHNSEESSDIVSEAFIRVYNALPNFKGQSSFGTWLYRILTNCFLDQRKKEKNRHTLSLEISMRNDDGEITRQIESDDPSPADEAERSTREEAIQNAVHHLPEYQQAMIIMYHAEMLSYEEIAAALDLPIGTVKSRLNRARQQLGELLAKNQELFNLA
jgi:RNA polymerase sigma-70 factor, ECF subfamily